jgi:hypothetical protein
LKRAAADRKVCCGAFFLRRTVKQGKLNYANGSGLDQIGSPLGGCVEQRKFKQLIEQVLSTH